jgi:surface carbohydrate biosynthesis protein
LARIYIHIEIAKREFNGRFLLALMAAERGHTVLLGHLKPLVREGLLAPGIVHEKCLTPSHGKFSRWKPLKERGFLVTSIDEESGILGEDYGHFAQGRYSEGSLAIADAVFFWGAFDHDYMMRTFPKFADRYHVTGNPRVDMWRPEMKAFYGVNSPNPRPFVLLPANFGSIFGQDSLDVVIKRLRRIGYIKPESLEDIWEANTYRFWQEGVELGWEFIKAFRKLARRFPEADFVVRPHPTEAPERWRELLNPNGNLILRPEGSISPWIRHARAIVNHGCTSALESTLAGVPVVSYESVAISNPDLDYPRKFGVPARSYDELEAIVGSVLTDTHSNSARADMRLLGSRLEAIEGPFAAERIVDVWDKLDAEHLRGDQFWAPSSWLRSRPYCIDTSRLASLAGLSGKKRVRWKFPPFDIGTVLEAQSLFSQCLGRFSQIPVKLIGPRILKIG